MKLQINFGTPGGVALIQANGLLVELARGSVAALVVAYGWRGAWKHWTQQAIQPAIMSQQATHQQS